MKKTVAFVNRFDFCHKVNPIPKEFIPKSKKRVCQIRKLNSQISNYSFLPTDFCPVVENLSSHFGVPRFFCTFALLKIFATILGYEYDRLQSIT